MTDQESAASLEQVYLRMAERRLSVPKPRPVRQKLQPHRLTDDQVWAIRGVRETTGTSFKELGRLFQCSSALIWDVVNRKGAYANVK